MISDEGGFFKVLLLIANGLIINIESTVVAKDKF